MPDQDIDQPLDGEWRDVEVTVELEGMLRMLAHSLYPRADVAIRELLANGTDALSTRRALQDSGGLDDVGTPLQIKVHYDTQQRRLIVEDTGCGMTADDIRNYVNKIGVSGTKVRSDSVKRRDYVKQLIGQFGVGLLACFKLGDTVTIATRTATAAPDDGVEWRNEGGQARAQMRRRKVVRPGTVVTVHVTDPANHELLATRLPELVRHYGDLLPFPIVDNYGTALNSYGGVPWVVGQGEDAQTLSSYLVQRAQGQRINPPLWVWPVQPVPDVIEMHGVIYIPDDRRFTNSDGSVDLYVRGVLVRKDLPGILPESLYFCHGVVDCADLTMILSREDIMRDSRFNTFRARLSDCVLAGLRDLATRHRDFDRVQHLFDREMKAAVAQNDALFDALGPAIRFFASDSRTVTLAEYEQEAARRDDEDERRCIYYLPSGGSPQARFQVDTVLQQKRLRAIEIVDDHPIKQGDSVTSAAAPSYDRPVLEKYAERHDMRLVAAMEAVEEFEDTQDASWDSVKVAFLQVRPQTVAWDLKVAEFEPESLPILLRAADLSAIGETLEGFAQAMAEWQKVSGANDAPHAEQMERVLALAKEQARRESETMHVVINARNPLMQQFRDALNDKAYQSVDPHGEHAGTIAGELYHTALQYTGYQISERSMNTIIDWRSRLVSGFLTELMDRAGSKLSD